LPTAATVFVPRGQILNQLSVFTAQVPVGPAEKVICGVIVVAPFVRIIPLARIVVSAAPEVAFRTVAAVVVMSRTDAAVVDIVPEVVLQSSDIYRMLVTALDATRPSAVVCVVVPVAITRNNSNI